MAYRSAAPFVQEVANGEKFKLQEMQIGTIRSLFCLRQVAIVASPMPSMPSSPSAKPYTYILSYLILKLISVPHFLSRPDGSANP